MQRLDDFLDRFVHVYAVFFLTRVREMADYVSKQDTPRSGLRLTVCLPHTDVQRAVETFLCDPRANHLHRVFITLRSRWNNECAHSFGGLTRVFSGASARRADASAGTPSWGEPRLRGKPFEIVYVLAHVQVRMVRYPLDRSLGCRGS